MYKFYLYFLFILLPLSTIYANSSTSKPELVTELINTGYASRKTPFQSQAYANLFIKIFETTNAVADCQFEIKENNSRINVLATKLLFSNFDLTLGRQLFAWGDGYNFNPTDIFNMKPLGATFDPMYLKTGRDALTLSFYFLSSSLDLIYAPGFNSQSLYNNQYQLTLENQADYGFKLKTSVCKTDLALSCIHYAKRIYQTNIHNTLLNYTENEDTVLGLSTKGTLPIWDLGAWLEIARYLNYQKSELCLGFEYFFDNYTFIIEYYRNGFGTTQKSAYNPLLKLANRHQARDYLAPSLAYQANEKLSFTSYLFLNCGDQSYLLGTLTNYLINDNLEIGFIPMYLVGALDTEFGSNKTEFGSIMYQLYLKYTF
jgi:hypothetical protein